MDQFRLFPEQASTASHQTDALYYFLWTVTMFFTLLIFALIVGFAMLSWAGGSRLAGTDGQSR